MGLLADLVTVKGGGKAFGDRLVFHRWHLSLAPGERVALLGPSGCGKTTFLRILAGMEDLTVGSVAVSAQRIAFVFQEPRLIPWLTVRQNLAFVSPDDPMPLLSRLGLGDHADAFPQELSGGMRQRVNLARALLVNPDLMLLDEAFSSLDVGIKIGILEDLGHLWRRHPFALVVVTHNPREALLLADRILVIRWHPAKISEEIVVSLPEDRSYADPAVNALEAEVLKKILQG